MLQRYTTKTLIKHALSISKQDKISPLLCRCDNKFSLNVPLMIIHHLVYPTKLSPVSNLLRSLLNKYIASIYAEFQNNLKLKSGGFSPTTLSRVGGCSPTTLSGLLMETTPNSEIFIQIHSPLVEKFFQ